MRISTSGRSSKGVRPLLQRLLMRLWSIHPKYLDRRGLVALWREGLLALKVLSGETRGYRRHPQLARFRTYRDPLSAIAVYLENIADEADRRGYAFHRTKISKTIYESPGDLQIPVTRGQAAYELAHLRNKLALRDPEWLALIASVSEPELNPIFFAVDGPIEPWEKIKEHT